MWDQEGHLNLVSHDLEHYDTQLCRHRIGRTTLPTAAEHAGTGELQLLWKYRLSLSSLSSFAMN